MRFDIGLVYQDLYKSHVRASLLVQKGVQLSLCQSANLDSDVTETLVLLLLLSVDLSCLLSGDKSLGHSHHTQFHSCFGLLLEELGQGVIRDHFFIN